MLDSIKVTLIVGVATVFFGVVLLACFAYMNTGSRNISFAVAALGASTAMLLLTLFFDLQGSTVETMIATEYTIDARTPRIRQWVYPSTLGNRYISETTASTEALQINPEMFTWGENGEKLAHNMIIFSILSYLIEQHDWQAKKEVVVYSDGIATRTSFISTQNSCSLVTYDELRKALSDSGNIFGTFKWYSPFKTICLPPETTISITPSSVTVSNPFWKIVFDVEEHSSGFAGRPTRRGDNPMLENGNPQFWTWQTPIRVTTQYSGWRAQHRDKQKYQDWAQSLVEGIRRWFGTVTDHSAVSFNADEENSGNELKIVTTAGRN
jgi:hypothetical protein